MNLYRVELLNKMLLVVYLLAENDTWATIQVRTIYPLSEWQMVKLERLTGNTLMTQFLRGSWESPKEASHDA